MFIIDWLLWYVLLMLCTFGAYVGSSLTVSKLKMTNTQGDVTVALSTLVGLYVGLCIAA